MAVITKRPEARPPYEAYARIMGVFAGGLAVERDRSRWFAFPLAGSVWWTKARDQAAVKGHG